MSEKNQKDSLVRGERMHFTRREHTAFHEMPSARAVDPLIVHSHPRRRFPHICLRLLFLSVFLVAIGLSFVVYVIESGSIDQFLAAKANQQIRAIVPDGYDVRIAKTTLRISADVKLKLRVHGVKIVGPDNQQVANIDEVDFTIKPLGLAVGQILIGSVAIANVQLNAPSLPATSTFRLTDHRVDSLPVLVEQIFKHTDLARNILTTVETRSIRLSDINFPVGSASPGQTVSVDVREVHLNLMSGGVLRVDGEVSLDKNITTFSLEASDVGGRTTSVQAEVDNLVMTPFLLRANKSGKPLLGIEGTTNVALSLKRAKVEGKPEVYAEIDVSEGRFIADSVARPFSDARFNLTYDMAKRSIELTNSSIEFDGSRFPFTGGILDFDKRSPSADGGYILDFLVSGGRFKSLEPGLPSLLFDAKLTGEYHPSAYQLILKHIAVSSPQGVMTGSFKAIFGVGSPEISFSSRIEHMDTEAVKQLWPFWVARKPREWVSNNLHGGVVTNGDIAISLAAGRLKGPGIPVKLDEAEMRIGFDIDDTRITLNDTFPDVIRSDARVTINGGRVDVDIHDGALSVAKGRQVTLKKGKFEIADAYEAPLMGAVDVTLTGKAHDLVHLAAVPPINALKNTDFKDTDFSGTGTVAVKASFPLDSVGASIPPSWSVHANIVNGALNRPVSGRKITKLNGVLNVIPAQISFNGQGGVDGVPVDIGWQLPLSKSSATGSALSVAGMLSSSQRDKLFPGLERYVDGPIAMKMDGKGGTNRVSLDLKQSSLSLPWIGWMKPVGVDANISFDVSEKNGVTSLNNLKLSGKNQSARGHATIDKGGLRSVTLTKVALAQNDDFNVAIQKETNGFDISMTGRSISAKGLLDMLKKGTQQKKGPLANAASKHETITVNFDIARVMGEGRHFLSSVKGELLVANGYINTTTLSAKVDTGLPLTFTVAPDGGAMAVHMRTSGTGALLRFLGVYKKMSQGKLNLDMIASGKGWQGMTTLTDFSLINDDQLKRLLSGPSGQNGRSLNAVYGNKINGATQNFQHAQVIFELSNGVLKVSDGFARGDQVGATFKGVVRDAAGNIDLSGTFMPAYGLNRIFAEIPIIGPILGNGQDKGLFGITFKLAGKTADPDLVINPLSIIAPGVFRQIFEFQ